MTGVQTCALPISVLVGVTVGVIVGVSMMLVFVWQFQFLLVKL